jgi:hypothetical protein
LPGEDNTVSSIRDLSHLDLLIEDGTSPLLIAAGSVPALIQVLVHPGNRDPLFVRALAILCHLNPNDFISPQLEHQRVKQLHYQIELWFGQAPAIAKMRIDRRAHYYPNKELVFASSAETLAQSFSYQELCLLQSIQPVDLISHECPKLDSIQHFLEHMQRTISLIVKSIVDKSSADARIAVIERWLEIGECAIGLKSFQLVFEIGAALASNEIREWESVWKMITHKTSETDEKIRKFTSPKADFQAYRKTVATGDVMRVIPCFAIDLAELEGIHKAMPTFSILPSSGKEVWNFAKFREIASRIAAFRKPWARRIPFRLNPDLLDRIGRELSTMAPSALSGRTLSEIFHH